MTTYTNIDELFEAMKANDPATLDERGDFRTDLPTCGYYSVPLNAPETDETVWSWSETHMIVGHSSEDLEVASRPELESFLAGEISIGRYAEVIGLNKICLMQILADRGIPVVVADDEYLAQELDAVKRLSSTWWVIRESPNSYIESTGEREILETGGMHDDAVRALVECNARQLLQGEGGHGKWTVRPWPEDETCDTDQVYDFLVDELDVPEDEAERLVS